MFGFLKRLIFYPLALVTLPPVYAAVALLSAKAIDAPLVLHFAGLAAAFGVGFLLVRAIEGRSATRGLFSLALPSLAVAAIAFSMQRYAGEPFAATAPAAEPRRERWTMPDGATLSYMKCGAAGAALTRPVIFLHGGPAIPPRATTIDVVCAIGGGARAVYIYDQAGSGASSRLDDIGSYTVARHVADLEAVRLALGADTVDLVGVSWGTVLASHYIAAHPGRVAHGLFVSPGVLGPRKGDDIRYDFAPTASSDSDAILLPPLRVVVAGALARVNPKAAVNFMSQGEAGPAMDSLAANPGLEYQGKCKGARVSPGSSARGAGANYYANLMTSQDLRRATDPTEAIRASAPAPSILILRGACDYIPLTATRRYEAAFSDVAVVTVKGEGHSFLGARPDIVGAAAECLFSGKAAEDCVAH